MYSSLRGIGALWVEVRAGDFDQVLRLRALGLSIQAVSTKLMDPVLRLEVSDVWSERADDGALNSLQAACFQCRA